MTQKSMMDMIFGPEGVFEQILGSAKEQKTVETSNQAAKRTGKTPADVIREAQNLTAEAHAVLLRRNGDLVRRAERLQRERDQLQASLEAARRADAKRAAKDAPMGMSPDELAESAPIQDFHFAKPDTEKGDKKSSAHIFDSDRSRTVASLRAWMNDLEAQQAADVDLIAYLRKENEKLQEIAKARSSDLAVADTVIPECRWEGGVEEGTGRKYFLNRITPGLKAEIVEATGQRTVVTLPEWLSWDVVED